MTERELYEYALIEMNKVEAPSLILEDFNYFINKAVQQYINKVYNRYDINQQSSDDLRVLKATAILTPNKVEDSIYGYTAGKNESGTNKKIVYTVDLPDDYMHILNCIVEYEVKKSYKCYAEGDHVDFAARRLTADMASGIIHNVYMRPEYKRPYFYINNINNPDYNSIDKYPTTAITGNNTYNQELTNSVKTEDSRLANASKVRMELRFGNDTETFVPYRVYIDYIKAPMFIRLTQNDIREVQDHTRPLEFPDYACYEIVNELVKLLMENASDPRLQSNYTVNQTIADPTAVPQSQSSRDSS